MANWVSDIVRLHYGVDICLLQAGCLRSNSVMKEGVLTARAIANLLPQRHKMVVLKVPGLMIRDMLENSVQAYPMLDGRFATFSGIKFSFDPE